MPVFSNAPISITLDEINAHAPQQIRFLSITNSIFATIQDSNIVAVVHKTWSDDLKMSVGLIANMGKRQFLSNASGDARKIVDYALWHNPHYHTTGLWHDYTDERTRQAIKWPELIKTVTKLYNSYQQTQSDKNARTAALNKADTLAYDAYRYAFTGALLARVQQMLDNTASLPRYKRERLNDLFENHGKKSGLNDVALLAAPKTPAQNRAIIALLKEMQHKK